MMFSSRAILRSPRGPIRSSTCIGGDAILIVALVIASVGKACGRGLHESLPHSSPNPTWTPASPDALSGTPAAPRCRLQIPPPPTTTRLTATPAAAGPRLTMCHLNVHHDSVNQVRRSAGAWL